MFVAWVCPNCLSAQQRVFILGWPLAQDAHSNSGPLVQSSETMLGCHASSQSHCRTVPWGWGVFWQVHAKSGPGTQLPLCHFLHVNVSAAELWLHGLPVFRYLAWLSSGVRQSSLLPPQPQPQPLHPPTIVSLSNETYFLASLMKHEIQAFILALAGI